jgi:hypothetical protein
MKDQPQPLRGEAAWRAEVKEIAKRNDAARDAGAKRRAAKTKIELEGEARLARREAADRPSQPGR